MAIFPILETEEIVQELDKTRLNASSSYVSAGSSDISKVEIRPSKIGSYVDVTLFDAVLDWNYDFKVEIDALNNKLAFSEHGVEKTATLAGGSYTLAALAAEIASKMTAAGTQTYSVTAASDTFIIAAASVFSLLVLSGATASTSIFGEIGFSGSDKVNAKSYTADKVPYISLDVGVRITDSATPTKNTSTISKKIKIVSEDTDQLWSTDQQLKAHEIDILKYLPEGRATWKHIHRLAQTEILDWLDKEGYVDVFMKKITKDLVKDSSEMREWSIHKALQLIFESVSNSTEDIFHEKAERYEAKAIFYRDRAVLRLDLDKSGTVELGEALETRSCSVVRR